MKKNKRIPVGAFGARIPPSKLYRPQDANDLQRVVDALRNEVIPERREFNEIMAHHPNISGQRVGRLKGTADYVRMTLPRHLLRRLPTAQDIYFAYVEFEKIRHDPMTPRGYLEAAWQIWNSPLASTQNQIADSVKRIMAGVESKPIRVQFDMSESIWNIVVLDSQEETIDVEERSTTFIVEYANQAAFDAAITRFAGLIDYNVVLPEVNEPAEV